MTKRRWVSAVFVLAIGCSSGGSDDGSLKDAVRGYSAAFLRGDAAATVEMLSERCRDRIGAQLPSVVAAAAQAYGNAKITSLSVDEQSGNLARVTYRYDRAELDQEGEPWVKQGGRWKQDDC